MLKKRAKCTAILQGKVRGQVEKHTVHFELGTHDEIFLPTIHQLAAKTLITDWETEDGKKKEIVELSVSSGVISSHTAFIAVDEDSSEPILKTMKTYNILADGGALERNFSLNSSCSDDDENEECEEMGFGADSDNLQLNFLCEGELEYELESWSEGEGQERVLRQRKEKKAALQATAVKTDTLSQLIAAQQINGPWLLDSAFAEIMSKPLSYLESACPVECGGEMASIWATVLAVSLLQVVYTSQQDEWELIAAKANSWLKKQTLSSVTLEQLFQAARSVL